MIDSTTVQPAPPQTVAHAIARWLIRPLVATAITPNHVTTLRLLTGLAAALAFAAGDYVWVCWGGVLFVLSALLDRADGELARLSGHMSQIGRRYDLFSDSFSNAVAFIGIGFGLSGSFLGLHAIWLGVLAGGAIAGIFMVVVQLDGKDISIGDALKYPKGFDLDDVLFLIGPVAWLNGLLPLLLAAAVGAPAFLIFILRRYHLLTSRR